LSSNLNSASAAGTTIRSVIPARIDRLNWAPFHTRMVLALGPAGVLDGIEITIAGAVAAVLTDKATLGLSTTQVGAIATVYLLGEVFGALSSDTCPTSSVARSSSS
jgi:hypothetical protein